MRPITFWRAVFSILGLATVVFFIVHVWAILIPFLLGLVAAYLIQPLVDRFVAMGLRRDRTVLVLYLFLLFLVVLLGVWLIPLLVDELNAVFNAIPLYASKFNALNDHLNIELNRWMVRIMGKKAATISLPFRIDVLAERLVTGIPENISSLAHFGLWIFIIPFVCYFSLAQGKSWMNALFNWTPSDYVEHLLGLVAEVNATLGGYIRGQLLDSMCVGVMTMVGLWILGFKQAVLIGFLTALLNPVPFLAPVVGGFLTMLIAYFQGMGASAMVGILSLFLLVRLCDDFIFTPFIVGQNVKLHPVVMLFAILAGVEMGGFLGLVFAVPTAAIIKVVLSVMMSSRRRELRLVGHHHIVS